MANQELIQYIQKGLALGASKKDIAIALLSAGWTENAVREGLIEVERIEKGSVLAAQPPPTIQPQPPTRPAVVQSTTPPTLATTQPVFVPIINRQRTTSNVEIVQKASPSPYAKPITNEEHIQSIFARYKKPVLVAMVVIIGGVALALGAYAYVLGIGPFSRPPFGEQNFSVGMYRAIAGINTATYTLSSSISVEDREAGATPLRFLNSPTTFVGMTRDATLSLSMSTQTDFRTADADWKTHVQATSASKGLSFSFDVDALRKAGVYYLRVNEMPEMFFLFLGGLAKGEWIKLDPKERPANAKVGSEVDALAQGIPDAEASYRASREDGIKLLQEAVSAADDGRLFMFKNKPTSERVEGRTLYRYDITLRKEVVVSFYERLLQRKNELNLKNVDGLINTQTLQYLKSAEWNDTLDDIQNNTTISMLLDTKGVPVEVTCRMRIVPPSEVAELKDKQVTALLKLTLTDMNTPLAIEAPEGAKSFEEMLRQAMGAR